MHQGAGEQSGYSNMSLVNSYNYNNISNYTLVVLYRYHFHLT